MTIKRGGVYRGMLGGDPAWLAVTKIEIDDKGRGGRIYSRVIPWRRLPRCVWWICYPFSESTSEFVERLDRCSSGHFVDEVKV